MVILSGAHSLIGEHILPVLRNTYQVCAFDAERGDIRDISFVEQLFNEINPSIIINCAQNSDIDECEYKREDSYHINGVIPGAIAQLCVTRKVKFVQLSTSYVFDGKSKKAYAENDPAHPVTVYGDSKQMAEKKILESGCDHLIIRVPHVYGKGYSFLSSYMERMKDAVKISLPAGQMIMPTFAQDVARMVVALIDSDVRGVIHLGNSGSVKIRDFLFECARRAGKKTGRNYIANIEDCDIEECLSPYDIPLNCVLDLSKISAILGEAPRKWEAALDQFIEEFSDFL
jgi:dTDP-4-dehydrorhamnose reductase